jgi:hypothetical protein
MPHIAAALDVNVAYFYALNDAVPGADTPAVADCISLVIERGATELLTSFQAMTPPQRSAFLELGKVIATTNGAITKQKDRMANQRRTQARQNGQAGQRGAG